MATPIIYQPDKNRDTTAIRKCEEYFTLWQDCKSWSNVFHEYYVHGQQPACDQWKEDYNNCVLWKTEQSVTAKEALIQSEQLRLKTVKDHKDESPPVWQLRTKPCPDWPKHPASGKIPHEEPS